MWWVYTAIKSPSLKWKVYLTKYVDSLHDVLIFNFFFFSPSNFLVLDI